MLLRAFFSIKTIVNLKTNNLARLIVVFLLKAYREGSEHDCSNHNSDNSMTQVIIQVAHTLVMQTYIRVIPGHNLEGEKIVLL